MEQQSGQDKRASLESIKAAAGEADIQGMMLEDALCLFSYSAGIRSVDIRIHALKSNGRLFSCCSSSCRQAAEPAGWQQKQEQ